MSKSNTKVSILITQLSMKSIWIWTRSKIKVNKLRSSLLQMEHLHIPSVYKFVLKLSTIAIAEDQPRPKNNLETRT